MDTPTVAVVGMSCRLPGHVDDPEKLWNLCSAAQCTAAPIPTTRFNAAQFYHPAPSKPGHFNVENGSYLAEDISLFDAAFFNITEAEAKTMDPQHRKLLECTFIGLENAGIALDTLSGSSDVGVFAASSKSEYEHQTSLDSEMSNRYTATGNAATMFANRVSYFFNLHGPSLTTDTACSSSLTALHLAVQSIRRGECSTAIVVGCFLQISPSTLSDMAALGAVGASGKSFSFDHRADGYGRGDGVGCLILRSQHSAEKQNDPIRVLIRATGLNHGGRSLGITLPNEEAQKQLIRQVYHSAGLDPYETAYVECHGTGTSRGDPIEVRAVAGVFTEGSEPRKGPLYIGSVKSNIGHTETASGIMSVIKSILMLESEVILPNANFEKANPELDLDKLGIVIPTSRQRWPANKAKRVSINNFGFGGSNGHAILEAPYRPIREPRDHIDGPPRTLLFTYSAKDSKALRAAIKAHATRMKRETNERQPGHEYDFLQDLSYTLCCRRTHFNWRYAVTASTCQQLAEKLESPDRQVGRQSIHRPLIYAFTGQGAQWAQQGGALLRFSVYKVTLQRAEKYLREFGATWSLLDEISKLPEHSQLHNAEYAQPAVTALQIALVSLLESWGLRASINLGHSSGEIAAAFAAGALDMRSCMAIAYFRGLAATKTCRDGTMMAVGADVETLAPLVDSLRSGHASIACYNSPQSLTVSGDGAAIRELLAILTDRGIFNRKLVVDTAYHSDHMLDVADYYLECLKAIGLSKREDVPEQSFISSLMAYDLDLTILRCPEYWVLNLTSPVQFSAATSIALDKAAEGSQGPVVIVEIGPHGALRGPIRDIIKSRPGREAEHQSPQYLSALNRGGCSDEDILGLAASLINCNQAVQVSTIADETTSSRRRVLTDLPGYTFTSERQYWHTSRLHQDKYYNRSPWNVLLGHRLGPVTGGSVPVLFRNVFSLDDVPWLRDHRISTQAIFPMAGYVSAVLEALALACSAEITTHTGFLLREVIVSKAFVLVENGPNDMSVTLTPYRTDTRFSPAVGSYYFEIHSWTQQSGTIEHCRGIASLSQPDTTNPVNPSFSQSQRAAKMHALRSRLSDQCTNKIPSDILYERAEKCGLEYGPTFRRLTSLYTGPGAAYGTVEPTDTNAVMPERFQPQLMLHPTLLDAMLHTGLCNMSGNDGDTSAVRCHVPTFIKELRVKSNPFRVLDIAMDVFVHNIQHAPALRSTTADLVATSSQSSGPVIEMTGLRMFKPNDDPVDSETAIDLVNPMTVEWTYHPAFLTTTELAKLLPTNVEEEEEARWRTEQACYYWMQYALAEAPQAPQATYLRRLRSWMEKTVARISKSDQSSRQGSWRLLDRNQQEHFLKTYKETGIEGEFYSQLGNSLPAILREEVQPLNVLMEENRLFSVYESSLFVTAFDLAGKIIDLISRQNTSIRICEVGSGTGGSAARVLERVMAPSARCRHYEYTDVSTGFFEAARQKFAAYSSVLNFSRLDLMADVEEQGLEANSFDIVLAADVIHATPDVQQSLKNIRRLLKPNGVLIMAELSSDFATMLPFATLPGWWNQEEGPILSDAQWHQALLEADFEGIQCQVKDNPVFDIHSIMMARAKTPDATPDAQLVAREFEIFETQDHAPSLLTTKLQQALSSHGLARDRKLPNGHLPNPDDVVYVCIDELFAPILAAPTEQQLEDIRDLLATAKAVLWVTRCPGTTFEGVLSDFVLGFARSVRRELAGLKFVVLQIEDIKDSDAVVTHIAKVFHYCFLEPGPTQGSEVEFRVCDGSITFSRAAPLLHMADDFGAAASPAKWEQRALFQPGQLSKLDIDEVGSLGRLHFTTSKLPDMLAEDEVLLKITATGLNFRDLLIALGQVPGKSFGTECCGVVVAAGQNASLRAGDRVVHVGDNLFASHVVCSMNSLVKIPDSLTDEEAASIGVIYTTAYECLVNVAKLRSEETVLIHAAAGGVGQALIMIAKWIGAEVYCTVGTAEKKSLIMAEFGISEDHIFWSRSADFGDCVRLATNGHGVDVLVNCLSGDLLRESWECMSSFGRFIEIGKRDNQANSFLEMAPFAKALTYSTVDLALLVQEKPEWVQGALQRVVDLIASGDFGCPRPIHAVPVSDVQRAFRNLQSGKVPGKTVVVNSGESCMVNVRIDPEPSMVIRKDCSYLITGGTGGLGRSLCRWLIERGATAIILVSRTGGDRSPGSDLTKLSTECSGARIHVAKCDVAEITAVDDMLRDVKAAGMPEVGGLVHGAMALHDSLLETVSIRDWLAVVNPKIKGALNLHTALQANRLDFFLCLSSAVAIAGNAGQSAYAGSNSVLDAFAQWRRLQGLPTAAVNLPAIREAGYVAEMMAKTGGANYEALLELGLPHEDFLRLIERALTPVSLTNRSPNYSSIVAGFPAMASRVEVYRQSGPLLSTLVKACEENESPDGQGQASSDGHNDSLKMVLASLTNEDEILDALCGGLSEKLSSILMIPLDEITRDRPIQDMGLDSLISVELRNWITRECDASISVMEVANSTSVLDMAKKILDRLQKTKQK